MTMIKKLLVLYNSKDEKWKTRVDSHVRLLKGSNYPIDIEYRNETVTLQSDGWQNQLLQSIDDATVIVLMVSKDFLESPFLHSNKIRSYLKSKKENGFPLFLILINKCNWKIYPWMKGMSLIPGRDNYLNDLNEIDVDKTLSEFTTDKIFFALGFSIKISQGILAALELRNTAHVSQLRFEPNTRLNLITGDNGFGKTLLLECVCWALTGTWASEYPVIPSKKPFDNLENVSIGIQLQSKAGVKENFNIFSFEEKKLSWPDITENVQSTGLVIYARVDGSFVIWDPVKSKIPPPVGYSKKGSPLFLKRSEVLNGLIEKSPIRSDRNICNGLIEDWVYWQTTSSPLFELLKLLLEKLSDNLNEQLIPAEPVRIPNDAKHFPALKYPYGDVAIVHAASSVQRITSLAYLIVWLWNEHKIACSDSGSYPYKNMIILIDEVESHLHPFWQRTIVPSLLNIKNYLDKEFDIQFIMTTHSPLIIASVEPEFNQETDSLFHLNMNEGKVTIELLDFIRQGRVDNWFVSDAFGLEFARSLKAQEALKEAIELQKAESPDKKKVKEVHCRLTQLLSEFDSFWPRWTYFAKQHGALDVPC